MQGKTIERKVRPTHPGAILRNMLKELTADGTAQLPTMTQTELAKRLGVSRRKVSELIRERGGMTADMAIRLSRVFKTTPDLWMNLQKAVDLWDATKSNKNDYAKRRGQDSREEFIGALVLMPAPHDYEIAPRVDQDRI